MSVQDKPAVGRVAPIVDFAYAHAKYDAAAEARTVADAEFRDADREFRRAWDALSPDEQRAVNEAFAGRLMPPSSQGDAS
jgi:hypothetical protein